MDSVDKIIVQHLCDMHKRIIFPESNNEVVLNQGNVLKLALEITHSLKSIAIAYQSSDYENDCSETSSSLDGID